MRWERFLRNCAFAVILFLLVDGLEATHLPGTETVRTYIAYAFTTDWDYRATLDLAKAGARGLATYTERLGVRWRPGAGPAPVTPPQAEPAEPSAPVQLPPGAADRKQQTGAAMTAALATSGAAVSAIPVGLRESHAGTTPPRPATPASTRPAAAASPVAAGAREVSAAESGQAPAASGTAPRPRLAWPARGPVTEHFGYRRHPVSRLLGPHEGIDLAVPSGAPVTAAAAGRVTAVFRGLTGGLTVELTHAGFTTRYLHLSSAKVKVGETVGAGALIALAGATGVATGPHLHFEVRMAGRPVDPVPLLSR